MARAKGFFQYLCGQYATKEYFTLLFVGVSASEWASKISLQVLNSDRSNRDHQAWRVCLIEFTARL